MVRSLIKLGLILVVGILVYNYFLGTPEEKATSKEIFREVKDLGKATWGLLKSEKDKFDQGKYDEAIDKVGTIFDQLKGHARDLHDDRLLDRVDELDRKRDDLKLRLQQAEDSNGGLSASEKEAIRRDWQDLMQETETLMQDIDRQ